MRTFVNRKLRGIVLEFRAVNKSFAPEAGPRRLILHEQSFRLRKGQRLGILAARDSGTSILLNLMCGLDMPDSGRILRHGRVSLPLGLHAFLDDRMDATETIRATARLYGLCPDYTEAFCRYLSGLGNVFDSPIHRYSADMRKRLGLSVQLALPCDLYLVDGEIPKSVDEQFNQRVQTLLSQRLHHAGLVMVARKPHLLESYCDSAAVLSSGRLHWFDSVRAARGLHDRAA